MKRLPAARSKGIVIQDLGTEVLIYDLDLHKAYNLNETARIIFHACDGNTSFDELKRKHKFTEDIIFLALYQLKKDNLLEESEQYDSPFSEMSRREVIRKAGISSMIALPVIFSLVAPTAVSAQSLDCSCGSPGDCLVKTLCPSTANCNPLSLQCTP
jgi:hypothetical protein